MTIIKGTHGRIGGAQPATRGPRSVLLPNQSFRYLTFDPDSVTAQTLTEALLPASDPATVIDLLQSLGAAIQVCIQFFTLSFQFITVHFIIFVMCQH